jgi:hypothetical protein
MSAISASSASLDLRYAGAMLRKAQDLQQSQGEAAVQLIEGSSRAAATPRPSSDPNKGTLVDTVA